MLEQEVQLTQEVLETIINGIDRLEDGIAILNSEGRFLWWNKTLVKLFSLPEHGLKNGLDLEGFIRLLAISGEYGQINDINKKVEERLQYVKQLAGKQYYHVRLNGTVIGINKQILNKGYYLYRWRVVSVSDYVLFPHLLKLKEERLHQIIDNLPAKIAYISSDGLYLFANRVLLVNLGISESQLVGHHFKEIATQYMQDYQDLIIKSFYEVLQGGKRSFEYEVLGEKNEKRFIRCMLLPDMGDENLVRGCFVFSIDISEEKNAQAAFLQSQKMEAIGRLTGGMAHDFNNLLTVIIGNLAILETGQRPDEVNIEAALRSARRGAELIRRLLTLSRGQALVTCSVNIGVLVHNVSYLLSRSLPETIRVRLSIPADPLYAVVDMHQLESALLNMALNARDAMFKGGVFTMRVNAKKVCKQESAKNGVEPGDYVVIDVIDQGSGIPLAVKERIFEPFYTTKKFGGGSGLGLPMVYGFMKQSGGNVYIVSTSAKGTHFRLLLPMSQMPEEKSPTKKSLPKREFDKDSIVLLVEDQPDVRKVIREQLMRLGYHVLEAEDGVEALSLIESVEEISLLITDEVMPKGIAGDELIERSSSIKPDLRCLLMTGYANRLEELSKRSDLSILRKPFDQLELEEAIRKLY